MITELVKLLFTVDDKASPEIQKLNGLTTNFLSGLAKGAVGAAAAFISVRAVFDGFSAAIERSSALDGLSQKTGIATDKLSELGYAARLNGGVGIETLATAFRNLGKAMASSDEESSKSAEALRQLGVEAKNADGSLRDSSEVFEDIATKFAELPNGAEKSTLAVKLFGQSGADLIPVLNRGAEGIRAMREEAEQFGVIIPPEAAEDANRLGDNVERAKSIFEGLFNLLSQAIVPTFNVLIEAFIDSAKEGGLLRDILNSVTTIFESALVPAVKVAAAIFNGFFTALRLVGTAIGGVAAATVALLRGDFAGARAIVSGMGEEFKQTAANVSEFQRKLFETRTTAEQSGKSLGSINIGLVNTAKSARSAKAELQGMLDALTIANNSFGQDESQRQLLEAELKFRKDIATIGLRQATVLYEQVKAQIAVNKALRENKELEDRVSRASDAIDNQLELLALQEAEVLAAGKTAEERDKIVSALRDQFELAKLLNGLSEAEAAKLEERFFAMTKLRDELKLQREQAAITNEIIDRSQAAIEADVQRRIEAAKALFEQGRISALDYTNYVLAQTERLKVKTEETLTELQEFWRSAAAGIQSVFANAFSDLVNGDLKDFDKKVANVITNIVAQILAAKAAMALFGKDFASGQVGGLIGSGISALFGGARASGGPVQAGRAYMVGERGPEPFIPSQSGVILPNDSLQGSNNFEFNITAIDSKDFLAKMAEVKREVADMMNNTNRSYGLIGAR